MIIVIKKIKEATAWTIKYLIEASDVLEVLLEYVSIIIDSHLISITIQIEIQGNEEIFKIILNNKMRKKDIYVI